MAKGDNTKKRKTVYEIVGENRPHFKRSVDPLDDLLLDEERELSREVKRIRLEQIVMKKRRELNRMRKGGDLDGGGPLPTNADFMNMSKALADLTPEEAQRVRSSYTFFKLAEKGGGGAGMNLLLPLIGYARQNPQASEDQMINYLKLMDSQLIKGMEIAKAANPKQSEDSTLKFLTLMKDLVIAGVRDPLIQAMKEIQPQPGIIEQIFLKPELFSRFKEIGFGGSNTATTHLDLEIEKLRGERQLQTTKWELEMRRDELRRQADDRRTETILAVFGPLAASFAGSATANKMQTLGQKTAAAHQPHNPAQTRRTPPPMAPQQEVVRIMCNCGYEGFQPLTSPPKDEIICPDSGQELVVNLPGTPPTEEN